ncbi:zinc finger protein 277 [Pectinophora gossypiella]|uniref:zinc finger protein 277 n=1 Tax=Pectinophora gossypiella TaxID=13191 RepID=UPI00214E0BCA|nr:zinc finger protein 277 [Pectinophora gossypiella]
MSASEKQFFGPLTLHQKSDKPTIFKSDEPRECSCVLCEENFVLPANEKQLLTHLFMEHRLVIADVNQISDLNEYLRYWRLRFRDNSLPFYCTTMLLDNKPDGTKSKNEEYYLLSDVLPEDKELRTNLQQTKLEKLLERHQFEREDKTYTKECLFCRYMSTTTRADYLNHLYEKHNFHIAKPDNLIFIDDLINTIEKKLEKLQCIFCEGYFKDRNILKEHMRKKGHKRINPDNKEYDKFFLVNYIGDNNEKPKHYRTFKTTVKRKPEEFENDSNVDSDSEWSEWTEENGPLITCLLCEHTEMEYENMLDHMERQHEFSFTKVTTGFDFYQKIKVVNYIRRQVHLKQCLSCDTKFNDSKNLEKHLKDVKHLVLLKDKWDQPEYYFSTYEDDLFLCFIHDDDESWWSGDEKEVENQNSMCDSISKEMAMAVLSE